MSKFIVSARKYRPAQFNEIVGQSHISKTLKNALKTDHLGHSFLFCGPRGVGKTTSARILAKVLNCENKTEDFEPCNECNSCVAFNENQSFNIYELDAASNNSVDNIRELVEQVRFPPQHGEYKVYIIDEVHMLSSSAFNAFLKTLEEPPSYAIFILATTEKHKIIPTILSRCQIFDFHRVKVDDIVNHLQMICNKEGIHAEESGLHVIAQKADGALRDALSIFDRIVSFTGNSITYENVTESLNILDYDTFFNMTDALLLQDKNSILLQFNDVLSRGFDGDQVMLGLAEHFRNLLVARNPDTNALIEVAPGVIDRYITQAEQAKLSFLLNALNIANSCDLSFKQAKNKRLHVELALLKICYLGQLETGLPLPKQHTTVKKNNEPHLNEGTNHSQQEIKPSQEKKQPVKIDQGEKKLQSEEFLSKNQVSTDEKKNSPSQTDITQKTIDKKASEEKRKEEELDAQDQVKIVKESETKLTKKTKKVMNHSMSFKLSNLHNDIKKIDQTQEEKVEENDEENDDDDVLIDGNDVVNAWYSLESVFSSQTLQNAINDSQATFTDGLLSIKVVGQIAKDLLSEHHNTIVDTIKSQTNLRKFQYELSVIEIKTDIQKTYTKEEQLEYIKQKNPAIKRLCDELNLEIDYK